MTYKVTTPEFNGLDTHYISADGVKRLRVHLDGAASPLAAKAASDTFTALLPHYSNTHSYVHTSAQISSQALTWAQQTVLDIMGADSEEYASIFTGSGTTAAINRIARGLSNARPERKLVLVSAMEHHANDLPHRQFDNDVLYIPLLGSGAKQGCIDLDALEQLLTEKDGEVNYLAFSSVSNVTGIANPVREITKLAHRYDALVLVDAAQSVAHQQTRLSDTNPAAEVDFFVFSGHKLYTPSSPGVMIAKRNVLEELSGQDLGGGSVTDVSYFDFELATESSSREQSGTPNIIGAIALAKVLVTLNEYGYDKIEAHTKELNSYLKQALSTRPHIRIYGDLELERVSAISFNHSQFDHGLLAAILNDYYGIAVRNECFCAHPYVSSLLKEELWELDLSTIAESEQTAYIKRKRGMVRVSTSLYNSLADIDLLVDAIIDIENRREELSQHYVAQEDGSYSHRSFTVDWRKELGWLET